MDPKTGKVGELESDGITPVKGLVAPKEKPDPKQSPVFLAREEMARRAEARRQEEMDENNARPYDILNDDGTVTPGKAIETKPEVAEDQPIPASAEDAPETQPSPTEIAPQVQEPEEERELIVDGKTIKVPLSKIIDAGVRTFQKETAADMRLAAAAQLEHQARERMKQFEQPKQQSEFAQKPQVSEDDAALAHAIQFGTEDQAKDAIASLRNAGRGSPQEVQGLVQKHVMNVIPEVMKFHDANNWVRTEYKEIFEDPMLEQQFMLSENARRQNGDARPHRELYKELADTMLTKFHLREDAPAAPAATPTEGADQRMVRKANSPRPVQAAGGQKAPVAPTRQPTVTDFVERQRALRGLAPMPRKDQSI